MDNGVSGFRMKKIIDWDIGKVEVGRFRSKVTGSVEDVESV